MAHRIEPESVTSPDPEASVTELVALVREQQRQLDELRARLDATERRNVTDDSAPETTVPIPPTTSGRRQMLRRAGVAAAGAAVAAPLVARPAAAANGDPISIGQRNPGTNSTLLFSRPAPGNGPSVLTVSDRGVESDLDAVLAGVASGVGFANGVLGHTQASLAGTGTGHAVVAYPQVVPGSSEGAQPRSNLWMRPTLPDPRSDSKRHTVGELVSDVDGDLWHCVDEGAPGTWRRLSGPATAGSFVAIDPARVYDSRPLIQTNRGRIFDGDVRTFSISDQIDVSTGAVVQTDVVPLGATAIAYNLAVTNTLGGGYLYLAPGDAAGITAASINWDENVTGSLNNGSIVRVDAGRQLRVFCGGGAGGSTNFVIDVVGYWL